MSYSLKVISSRNQLSADLCVGKHRVILYKMKYKNPLNLYELFFSFPGWHHRRRGGLCGSSRDPEGEGSLQDIHHGHPRPAVCWRPAAYRGVGHRWGKGNSSSPLCAVVGICCHAISYGEAASSSSQKLFNGFIMSQRNSSYLIYELPVWREVPEMTAFVTNGGSVTLTTRACGQSIARVEQAEPDRNAERPSLPLQFCANTARITSSGRDLTKNI